MRLSARVLRWYSRHGRDLPWRRTRDPYAVLVSEVMLQQTQVSRVVPAYERFLRRFPTLGALSRAALGDALRAWGGLGYNRRARDLHRAARLAGASLPRTVEALDALPGVGRYTAGAVACFAYRAPVPFADTNIRRVLGRVRLGRMATEREAEALDRAALPARAADRWHHALMDIGALFCRRRAPRCEACPLRPVCRARGEGRPVATRRQSAFATSDRRVRGRIVAELRAVPRGLPLGVLARRVGDSRTAALASRLVAEGLLARDRGRLHLP
jgi:A/G-specific adenine glycosylase